MDPDENQPLLARPLQDLEDDDDILNALPQDYFTTADRVSVLVLLSLILFTVELSTSFTTMSMYRVQAEIICRQHGGNDTCPAIWPVEPGDVLVELDGILRVKRYLAVIPGLLTALPYGLAADRYSRRNLLALCIAGGLLSLAGEIIVCMFYNVFPLRLVWFTTLLTLIGGGPQVFYAFVFAIATDVSSRAQRSTHFLFLGSIVSAASLVGFRLSQFFMSKDPWVSIYLGLAMLCIATVLVLFIPATRDASSTCQNEDDLEVDLPTGRIAKLRLQAKDAAKEIASIVRVALWANKQLSAVFLGLFVVALSSFSFAIAILSSFRFGVKWQPQKLIYISMGSGLVLTAAILPLVAQLLIRRSTQTPIQRDLWLLRALIFLLFIGALLTGFSNSIGVLIAGTALMASSNAFLLVSRSLLSLLSREQHVAVLLCLMSVVGLIASLIGEPLLRWLWELGWNSETVLRGLPFLVLAVLFAFTVVVTVTIKAGDERDELDEDV